MRLHLTGNDFDFVVEGNQRYRQGTSRDTMGDDCYASWRWFEGSGKVVEKSTGKETVFLIRTRHIEFGSEYTLEQLVYRCSTLAQPLPKRLVPGREPYLADLIARQTLAEIAADKQNVIPHCHLGSLDYGQLVAQGIIAGGEGELTLPGLAVTR